MKKPIRIMHSSRELNLFVYELGLKNLHEVLVLKLMCPFIDMMKIA
jgi:hypothetical protein